MALRREGLDAHPRVRDGIRLLIDRAIPTGGWNYGNSKVFGRCLRPQPGPTALALLALAGTASRSPVIAPALDYLERTLPDLHAGWSLGWAWLALRVWDRAPRVSPTWLAEAAARARATPRPSWPWPRSPWPARSERPRSFSGEFRLMFDFHKRTFFGDCREDTGSFSDLLRKGCWVPRVPPWEPVRNGPGHGFPRRNPWHPSASAQHPGIVANASICEGKPMDRRRFLAGMGAAAIAGAQAGCGPRRPVAPAAVFVAQAATYEVDLVRPIRDGLAALGIGAGAVRDRVVLLKPNLVEPSRHEPHINTHPAVVRAAAEVFLGLGARAVLVAEGQGHCRDAALVLELSGLGAMLDERRLSFVDLNHDEVYHVPNRLGRTRLPRLFLPATLRRADLIVSMPKMKTHHWAGVTLAMKNLFGVMPGIYYGWPKNVLHQQGIPASILDINATVRPHLAIVDGIVGMEGDGPIMGVPKHSGVLVLGTNLPAVDATAARLMDVDPRRIAYLTAAEQEGLGPITASAIVQRGEPIAALAQRYEPLHHPAFPRLR